jgi:hypothetical protein
MEYNFKSFFANSQELDYLVLRPLSHMDLNWELSWDQHNEVYKTEGGQFAEVLNKLIVEIAKTNPPIKYHDNEDCLAEYVKSTLNLKIYKERGRWLGTDYETILTQGGFEDLNEENLIHVLAGRIKAAIDRKQNHFDNVEKSHKNIIGFVMSIVIYLRYDLAM